MIYLQCKGEAFSIQTGQEIKPAFFDFQEIPI